MLRSMTGFGSGEYCDEAHKIHVEIKSVNHRYQDMTIRLPKALNPLEDEIRKLAASSLIRGKIDVFVSIEEVTDRHKKIKVDKDLAIAYHGALKDIALLLDLPRRIDAEQIARYPDVLTLDEESLRLEDVKDKLMRATAAAVDRLVDMRSDEGKNMYEDLSARINNLVVVADAIKQREPQIAAEYRDKLSAKMEALLAGAGFEESRILQEVILFAEKISFTEELVRLGSHIKQFKESLETSGEAVGRKLDFIVQEMNRETNTIASKANDAVVAGYVVDIKSELEKIREQIQNIE